MPQNGIYANGTEVRSRREALVMSQEMLAAKARIHPNTLAKIESDPSYRTGFKTLRSIAKVYRCDPSSLLRASEEVAS